MAEIHLPSDQPWKGRKREREGFGVLPRRLRVDFSFNFSVNLFIHLLSNEGLKSKGLLALDGPYLGHFSFFFPKEILSLKPQTCTCFP